MAFHMAFHIVGVWRKYLIFFLNTHTHTHTPAPGNLTSVFSYKLFPKCFFPFKKEKQVDEKIKSLNNQKIR